MGYPSYYPMAIGSSCSIATNYSQVALDNNMVYYMQDLLCTHSPKPILGYCHTKPRASFPNSFTAVEHHSRGCP